jgi:hypothetical protein
VGGAAIQVVPQQFALHGPERRMDGGALLEDVGAVSLFVHHALNSFHLPADSGKTLEQVALGVVGDTHCM